MRPRSVTIPLKKFTKGKMKEWSEKYPERHTRPVSRHDCRLVPRPCPFVGCRYNLYLDVNERTGSIKFNFKDMEPGDMEESCALDMAARGRSTLEIVGSVMNRTRERVRQIEEGLFENLALREVVAQLQDDFVELQRDRDDDRCADLRNRIH